MAAVEIFLRGMRWQRPHRQHGSHLALAYAGQFTTLLLLFSVANRSPSDVLTSEGVAIEIARPRSAVSRWRWPYR